MATRMHPARLASMTLSRWDAVGISADGAEARRVLNAVTAKGSWGQNFITVGDVVKMYICCDVLGVDKRATIYNVALAALGDRLRTNRLSITHMHAYVSMYIYIYCNICLLLHCCFVFCA